jgi:hypothetical protein
VFISPFSDKSKATAVLFKTNDPLFSGRVEDTSKLLKDILQYSMYMPPMATTWNLDGQTLLLKPEFDFNAPTSVKVVLERSQLSIKHDPIFLRTDAFA